MVPVWLPSVLEGDEESVAVMVLPLLSVVGLSDFLSVAVDLSSVAEVSVADDLLSVAEGEALSCVLVACAVFESVDCQYTLSSRDEYRT